MNSEKFFATYPQVVARIRAALKLWATMEADDREDLSYDVQRLLEDRRLLDDECPPNRRLSVENADAVLYELEPVVQKRLGLSTSVIPHHKPGRLRA